MSGSRIQLRMRPVAEIDEVPGGPEGVRLDVSWEVEGTGLVGVGWLYASRPGGGPNGKLVLWGAGIWPAEMSPSPRVDRRLPTTSPGTLWPEPTCEFVVHTASGSLTGLADQPGVVPRWPLWVRLLLFPFIILSVPRNSKRKIRLQLDGRTWWLRGGFKIRVYREDGFVVLKQKGRRWSADPAADQLDLAVALLAVSSFDRDAYSVP